MYYTKISILLLAFGLFSCAHHKDVRPGEDGVHRVVVREQSQEMAERNAINQAKDYCSSLNAEAVFLKEKTKYTGSMNESARDTIHKASKAALILGGNSHRAQNGKEDILGSAGVVGHTMTSGDDYLSDMTFKCR